MASQIYTIRAVIDNKIAKISSAADSAATFISYIFKSFRQQLSYAFCNHASKTPSKINAFQRFSCQGANPILLKRQRETLFL